jgi:hypothetical protein
VAQRVGPESNLSTTERKKEKKERKKERKEGRKEGSYFLVLLSPSFTFFFPFLLPSSKVPIPISYLCFLEQVM